MPQIWCMNLIDNRDKTDNRNVNAELKFQLCRERSMLAIGWAIPDVVNTWKEYKKIADKKYPKSRGYAAARNNLEKIKKGDIVWTKNPVTGERFIVEIQDDYPGIYSSLKEFDTCAYRKGTYYPVSSEDLCGALSEKKISARHSIEKMRNKRLDTIEATKELFNKISEKTV